MDESREIMINSLRVCMQKVKEDWHLTDGGRSIAEILGSLYNSRRVRVRLGRALRGVSPEVVNHLINVMRLHAAGHCEIHTFFDRGGPNFDSTWGATGNEVFEAVISEYGLETEGR